MPPGQILNRKIAEFAAHGLQDIFIACSGRGPDLMARTQPIRASLFERQRGRLHVGTRADLALNFGQRCAGFFLGSVATA